MTDIGVAATPRPPALPPVEAWPAGAAAETPDVRTASGRAGTFWTTAGTLVSGGLNYLYVLLLTGVLTGAGYAVFTAANALLLVVGTVANAAVPWVLAQEVARLGGLRPGAAVELARRRAASFAVLANLAQGAVAALVVGVLAARFASPGQALLLAAAAAGFFLASTPMGWAQGVGAFHLLAVLVVVEVAVKVALGVSLAGGLGVTGALLGTLLGAGAVLLVGVIAMGRDVLPARGALRLMHLWRAVGGVTAVQGLVTLAAVVDVLLAVIVLHPSPAVAHYQLATTLGRTPVFLSIAVSLAVFPALSVRPGARELLNDSLRSLLRLALPVAVVLMTLPRDLVESLLPASYGASVRWLPITATTGLLYAVANLAASWYNAAGHYRPVLAVLAAGTLLSVAAITAAALAWGLAGVAWAALAGAAAQTTALLAMTQRRWPGAPRVGAATLLVPAGAGLLLLALHGWTPGWLVASALLLGGSALSVFRPGLATP